jgi:cytochrome c oxidase cbb3-type subunit 3
MSPETDPSHQAEAPDRRPLGKNEVRIRPHVYDGIQEYDQRLPNWWLYTLYGAIIFSFFYWLFLFQFSDGDHDTERLAAELERIEAVKMAAVSSYDDATLWRMASNAQIISNGEVTYQETCASCHAQDLSGGIGLNLADADWKYGGQPTDVFEIVLNGSPDKTKGMQAWKNQLGPQRIAEVTAFIMSHHPAPDG